MRKKKIYPALRARAVLLVIEHADLVEPDPSQPRLVGARPGLAAVVDVAVT